VEEQHRQLIERLKTASRSAIFVGQMAQRHVNLAEIEWLAAELARVTNSVLGHVSEGSNAAGLALAGVLPHRGRGGDVRLRAGATAADMAHSPPHGLVLFGIEPHADCADGGRVQAAMAKAKFTVACSSFMSDELRAIARVLLPVASSAETAGTFVNAQGLWQSFEAAAKPPGEARPAWKVLRVLGNRLGVQGFDYASAHSIRDELRTAIGESSSGSPDGHRSVPQQTGASPISQADLDVGLYRSDPLVRRSVSLQMVAQAETSDQTLTRRHA
jgi:NADH-quinone oxidoreductase subunit G